MAEDGQRQESVLTVCTLVIQLHTTADKASACVYIHLSAVGAALCETHSYSLRVKRCPGGADWFVWTDGNTASLVSR